MRSIQEEEVSNKCVDSLVTWYNPNCDVMLSITICSKVGLSRQRYLKDSFGLFFAKFNSNFLKKVSKSSRVWQEIYKEI